MDVDQNGSDGGKVISSSQEKRWSRPSVPSINPSTDSIVFQQIDIDSYSGQPLEGNVTGIIHVHEYLMFIQVGLMHGIKNN